MARSVSRSAAATAREVKVVVSRLRRRIQALALTDDLSGSQAAVLSRLHKEGPSSSSVLAGAESVSHQAIGAILTVLQTRTGKVDHEAVETGRQPVESRSPIEICWKRREQNE
jgi:hypothetical protein